MEQRLTPVSRTSFALTDRDAFDGALSACLSWIEKTAEADLPPSAGNGLGFEFQDAGALASVSASRLDDSSGQIWAAKVTFTGDKVANREWITDLFVESRTGDLTRFGAQLVCRHDLTAPGFEHSRPNIVREVIDKFSAETDSVPIFNQFTEIAENEVDQFVELLGRPDRRLPIILISTDDVGGAQVDLDWLARRVSGTAHLRTIKFEASYELSRSVGKQLSTFDGAARIYLPGIDLRNEDHLRHPIWFAPRSGYNPKATNQIISRVLPLGFRDSEGGTRFWRLGLLRQAASRAAADAVNQDGLAKAQAEKEALEAELRNAKEEVQTAESLMNEEAARAAELGTEVARLEQENYDLRQRIRGLQSGRTEASLSLNEEDVSALADGRPSLETSLNVLASVFPERIVVLQSAIESARDSAVFKHKKKAFDLLWSLATVYHQALSNGESDNTARQCFGSSYAAKEKETLSKAGRDGRTFEYNGQSIEMMRHLKIGVADNKAETLRVHFEWLASEGKIVIGHCGAHINF